MPQKRKIQQPPGVTGLIKHGSIVSLAPARAVTSHARRLYHERYKPHFRYPKWVFGFDLFLVAIALTFFIFDLSMYFHAAEQAGSGVALELQAPALKSSDIMPLDLTLRSTDGKLHQDVRLQWHLPAYVEVIKNAPQPGADGYASLGDVAPGQDKSSHLLVRIHAPAGGKVLFGFSLKQNEPLFWTVHNGYESRTIESSALTVKPVFPTASYVTGASVPVVVQNAGHVAIPAVTLRLAGQDGAPQASLGSNGLYSLGQLNAGDKRLVFVDLGATEKSTVSLSLELSDGAQVVDTWNASFNMASGAGFNFKAHAGNDPGTLDVAYQGNGAARTLVSFSALASGGIAPYKIVDLANASGTSEIASDIPVPAGQPWNALPIDSSVAPPIIGIRQSGVASAQIPFSANARYYAASGDQLGVGPLPPVVGQPTAYWAVWSIGPFEANLRNVSLSTVLPAEVKAMGKFASDIPGDFKIQGQQVTWKVPTLDLLGSGAASFAFEIQATPSKQDVSQAIKLLDESSLSAQTENGAQIQSSAPGDDSNIQSDQKGKDRGVVELK